MKTTKMARMLSMVLVLVFALTALQLPVMVSADSVSITPADDTFVASGDANGNFATTSWLYVRSQEWQERISFLKFDISELEGQDITSATLGLYFNQDTSSSAIINISPETGTIPVYAFGDTEWNGADLKWNNYTQYVDLADETELGSIELDGFGKYYELDVTDYVTSLEANEFSVEIKGDPANTGKAYKFYSTNYSNGDFAPYLKIEYEKNANPVTGVNIVEDELNLRSGDDAVELTYEIIPSYADNKNVIWESDDEGVATVVDGVVTPVGPGTAIITVTTEDGGYEDSCVVNVSLGRIRQNLAPVADLYIAEGASADFFGDASTLYARSSGGNSNEFFLKFDGTELEYSSLVSATLNLYYFKDEAVSAVNGGSLPVLGLADTNWNSQTPITWAENVPSTDGAVEIGTLDVDAEAEDGFDKYYSIDVTDYIKASESGEYAFKVTGDTITQGAYKFYSNDAEDVNVRPYLSLVFNPDGISVEEIVLNETELNLDTASDDVQLTATIEPYNATAQDITWTSNAPSVATVKDGLVTVKGVGTATITAECDGAEAECVVNVALGQSKRKIITAVDTFIDQGDPDLAKDVNTVLYTKNYGGGVRTIFINFDGSMYADKYITSAKLYLKYYKDPAAFTEDGGKLPVAGLMDSEWKNDISLITYNNYQAYIGTADSMEVGTLDIPAGADTFGKYYSVDVTDYINTVDGTDYSFMISGVNGKNAAYKFYSADYADTTCVPYLEVYYNPEGIDAESVTLDKESITLESDDEPVQLTAAVAPALTTLPYVTWSTSNDKVATVVDGLVTPVGAGKATITATSADGKAMAECIVTVEQALEGERYVAKQDSYADGGNKGTVRGNDSYIYMRTGTTRRGFLQFDLSELDTSRKINSITLNMYYFMDTSSQSTIDVSAVNGGMLPLSAVPNCQWDETTMTWNTGAPDITNQVFLGNMTVDSQANGGFDKWYSAELTDVESYIDESGLLTIAIEGDAVSENKAYKFRSANYSNGAYAPYIEVKFAPDDVAVTGVSLDKNEYSTTTLGDTLQLTATLEPKYPSNSDITWSTSNDKVATVVNGLVTVVGPGTATITVETADGGFTDTCVVTADVETMLNIKWDTYVNGLSSGFGEDESCEKETSLYVRKDDQYNGSTRAAYIRTADYSDFNKSSIESANLYITRRSGAVKTYEAGSVSVYGVCNDWEENVVWKNQPVENARPDLGDAFYCGTIEIPAAASEADIEYDVTYSVDVSEFLKICNEKEASFIIVSDNKPYYFYSTETNNSAFRPHIGVKFGDATVSVEYGEWVEGGDLETVTTIDSSVTAGLSKVTVAVAIYDADDILEGITFVDYDVAATGDTVVPVTYYDLPGDEFDYYTKVFVWGDMNDIMPLATSIIK